VELLTGERCDNGCVSVGPIASLQFGRTESRRKNWGNYMAFNQFFILSPRGDTIIFKDYRGDAHASMQEDFFRKVKFWSKGDCVPVFQEGDFIYMYIKRNNLLLCATTKYNLSPCTSLELLNRMAKVFKDYCGVLTEESIRKNFILVYELLDEMLDMGFPQMTSTEALKSCVHNEPIAVSSTSLSAVNFINKMQGKTKESTASNIPISSMSFGGGGKQKNEIFVDIIERLTVLFNSNGFVVNSSIDGSIMMKSFLSGNPELRLALNEDLVVGKNSGMLGSVVLDDCNFHERVHLDEFESARTLHFFPPDGEFAVLNYRITADFPVPFRIHPIVEEIGPNKIDLMCTVRAEIPADNHGSNVIIRIPLPRSTINATCEFAVADVPGCHAEYNSSEQKVLWTIRKFSGGSELAIKVRITTETPVTTATKREIGPVSMGFEIPMFNVSNLQVRYLRISETHQSYNPFRWVRYITQSSSYVSRV
jgi:AP-4 complex subunit mu-1